MLSWPAQYVRRSGTPPVLFLPLSQRPNAKRYQATNLEVGCAKALRTTDNPTLRLTIAPVAIATKVLCTKGRTCTAPTQQTPAKFYQPLLTKVPGPQSHPN